MNTANMVLLLIRPLPVTMSLVALVLLAGKSSQPAAAAASSASSAKAGSSSMSLNLQRGLTEVASLYKGVVSAATGAGIIIGAYFAFYSTSKRFLREKTEWKEGERMFEPDRGVVLSHSVSWVAVLCFLLLWRLLSCQHS
jgi:preprotein translocase subunit SecG